MRHLSIETVPYRYFDSATRAMSLTPCAPIWNKQRPVISLLHGCCLANRANLNAAQWQQVVELLQKTGARR